MQERPPREIPRAPQLQRGATHSATTPPAGPRNAARCVRPGPSVAAVVLLSWLAICGGVVEPARAQKQPPADDTQPAGVEATPAEPLGATPEELLLQQILALKQRMDELLEQLPPELREEVSRRLAEGFGRAGGTAAEPTVPEDAVAQAPEGAEGTPGEHAGGGEPPRPSARGLEALEGVVLELAQAQRERRIRPRDPESCNTLWYFDNDQDGQLTALDRYWRHFYVWIDRDGNRKLEPAETLSLFDVDVKGVDVALKRFRGSDDSLGDVDLDEHIVLRLLQGAGALAVDADKIRRRDGPQLLGADGEVLQGVQPFRPSLGIREPNGRVTFLTCP